MNFLRQYSILFGIPGQIGTEISSVGVNRPLHVNFSLEKRIQKVAIQEDCRYQI